MAKASTSKIAAKRREYNEAKHVYNLAGKKARGKPKTSEPYRVYKAAKSQYKRIGQQLGKLTGRKKRQ